MSLRSSDGQVSVAAATPTHVSSSIHPGTGVSCVWSCAVTLAASPSQGGREQPRESPPDRLHAHGRPTEAGARAPAHTTRAQ